MKKAKNMRFVMYGLWVVFTAITISFAFIQKTEADKHRSLAELYKAQLDQALLSASQSQKEAVAQRLMAEEREAMAIRALEECKHYKRK